MRARGKVALCVYMALFVTLAVGLLGIASCSSAKADTDWQSLGIPCKHDEPTSIAAAGDAAYQQVFVLCSDGEVFAK